MTPKRVLYLVLVGLAVTGSVVLLVLRRVKLAGMLRAAGELALIKHDLTALKDKRQSVAMQDREAVEKVQAINHLIAAKEKEAIERPMQLKGASEEEIDAELRAAGLLK